MTARNPRFPLFDSLRAIAALSVVAFHLAYFTGHLSRDGIGRWLSQLNVGVAIFFLVSAFLLYRPFARARLAGDAAPATGAYALRRVLRIAPAYWVLVVVCSLVLGLAVVDTPKEVLTYLAFAQVYSNAALFGGNGLGHAWTLCVEVTFYALLPLWAFALRRIPFRSLRGFVVSELAGLAGLFAVAVIWQALVVSYPGGYPELSAKVATLPAYLDHFAVGMALAVVSVALAEQSAMPAPVRLVERAPWLPWLGAAVAFLVLGALTATTGVVAELTRHELRALVGLGVLLPAVFGDPARGWVRRLLARRELLWVGLVSYGLYLWHPPLMTKLTEAGMDGVSFAIVSVIASLAAAAASWYLVERWALRLGRRILHRPVVGHAADGPPAADVEHAAVPAGPAR